MEQVNDISAPISRVFKTTRTYFNKDVNTKLYDTCNVVQFDTYNNTHGDESNKVHGNTGNNDHGINGTNNGTIIPTSRANNLDDVHHENPSLGNNLDSNPVEDKPNILSTTSNTNNILECVRNPYEKKDVPSIISTYNDSTSRPFSITKVNKGTINTNAVNGTEGKK